MHSTSVIRFSDLQLYNKAWNLNTVALFVKIVVLSSRQGRIITMGSKGLMVEFRWKRMETVNLIKIFIDLGFITPLKTGVKQLKKYTVNVHTVLESIDIIYDFNTVKDEKERSELHSSLSKDLSSRFNTVYSSGRYKKLNFNIDTDPSGDNDEPYNLNQKR